MLVHPKDKLEDDQKAEGVYKIPCLNCDNVYVGETKKTLNVTVKKLRKPRKKEPLPEAAEKNR